ncbi:MAG: PqqD family protein [Vicinamibacterales bacterium]
MSQQPGRVRPAEHVLSQELEGETVLLNLETERYFGLDRVGTRFWQLLTEHGSSETVVTRMLEEFEVEEAALRADVDRLLEALTSAGLVIRSE